ncbi:glycosyltransferase [Xylanibacillus composti]|uniref:Glycosyltransferase n=1 Tax=Xylanibacillus composti TaxID=1572762 RepID=A0A8J4H1Q0_9BACL|nr:glycosyltransferase [Xylanibacillus composti]MDT9726736.1 glycosyltransferase [Xylanibacillus composti]GIQ69332.1 hypothetical protein XYCOK13_21560 [Xylanibacillus composti]
MRSVDVILPVYNQALPLELTLEGFARQTLPREQFTLVIVDDGSTEQIKLVAQRFSKSLPVRYIRLGRSGRAAARNAGVRAGSGDLLVFCDADRIPRPRFLEAHLNRARHGSEAIVTGQVREMYVTDLAANRMKARQQAIQERHDRIPQYCQLMYRLFDEHGAAASPIAWAAALSGNLSVSRTVFEQIGGFDEGFKEWGFEHFEFGYRGFRLGQSFGYEPQAVNVHLAHARDRNAYIEHMRASHAYFLHKHPGPAVEKLLDFMLGYISLAQFEEYAAEGRLSCMAEGTQRARGEGRGKRDGYVRIQNF